MESIDTVFFRAAATWNKVPSIYKEPTSVAYVCNFVFRTFFFLIFTIFFTGYFMVMFLFRRYFDRRYLSRLWVKLLTLNNV